MLSYVQGTVKERLNQKITLEIGPVGLAISVPDSTQFHVGNKTTVYMHLHWNMEQGPTLYGFCSQLERTVFVLITSCSGIGPKIALSVLSNLGAQNFLHAIQTSDERILSTVNGIGMKKAQQIIIQLTDKVAKLFDSGIISGDNTVQQWHTLTQTLQSLNYSRIEVTRAINHLKAVNTPKECTFDQLMRKALSFLSKQA